MCGYIYRLQRVACGHDSYARAVEQSKRERRRRRGRARMQRWSVLCAAMGAASARRACSVADPEDTVSP